MKRARTPVWVWGLCLGVGLVEPVTHLWLRYGSLGEGVFSGLHIGDTPFFLHAMRMFQNDFFSSYVTCQYAPGPHGPSLFPLVHHWLYGVLGWIGALLRADAFLFLGFANGAGGAFYLWAVYRFMRTVLPRHAGLGFVLFTFAGGVGGVLFLATYVMGWHGLPAFDIAFHRWARYELIEGPFLSPFLVQPRLYYTLPLALGYLALARCIASGAEVRVSRHLPALIALFIAASINIRLGPIFWFALVCYLSLQRHDLPRRMLLAVVYALPVAAGATVTYGGLKMNPALAEGIPHALARSIWFGSLVGAVLFHISALYPALKQGGRTLPRYGRVVTSACLGYLAAFALLYAVYQTYWGNWLARGDATAAVRISDPALVGALVGAMAGWRLRRRGRATAPYAWLTLWLLVLCALGVSAWGGGYWLRFMPERLLVVMPVPLAMLTAAGLHHWLRTRRKLGVALIAALLTGGLCSASVACLCFQGSLGFKPGEGPFTSFHTEQITRNEAAVVDALDGGVVLAPATIPLFSDIAVVRRPGVRTMYGQGTLGFGDVEIGAMGQQVAEFFAPETGEPYRRAFAETWCVDYILCPEAPPVAAETVAQLRDYPWTTLVLQAGDAMLLKVQLDD